MLALFFACLALFNWILVKSKSRREKWVGLLFIVLIAAWNISANFIEQWPNPFVIIMTALGWIS